MKCFVMSGHDVAERLIVSVYAQNEACRDRGVDLVHEVVEVDVDVLFLGKRSWRSCVAGYGKRWHGAPWTSILWVRSADGFLRGV